jgi:two-component system, OmpR family, phosphate regulon response regulator OmpR
MAKILVVDDELSFREAMYFAFTKRGHEVALALNADHARALMENEPFDLLILDVMMPGETGLEFLKAVRREGSKVPILMHSAYADISVEQEARRSGADEVVQKDIPLETMSSLIDGLLSNRRR